MPIPAIAWAILPSLVSAGTSYLNRPKKRDYMPDTNYIDKYIANLQGRRASREVEQMAMRPALRAIGQQQGRMQRQASYDAAKYGYTGSGIDVQQKLAIGQQATGALTQAAEQAGMAQYRENNRIEDYIQQLTMQKGQMIDEGNRAFRQARRQNNAQIFSSIAQGAISAGSYASQAAQSKAAIDTYANILKSTTNPLNPEDINTMIDDVSAKVKNNTISPEAAGSIFNQISNIHGNMVDINQASNMIDAQADFYGADNPEITTLAKQYKDNISSGGMKPAEAVSQFNKQVKDMVTSGRDALKNIGILESYGVPEDKIKELLNNRELITDESAITAIGKKYQTVDTNRTLVETLGIEQPPENILSSTTATNKYISEKGNKLSDHSKTMLGMETAEEINNYVTENINNISGRDFQFAQSLIKQRDTAQYKTDLAESYKTEVSKLIDSSFSGNKAVTTELNSIKEILSDPAIFRENYSKENSKLWEYIDTIANQIPTKGVSANEAIQAQMAGMDIAAWKELTRDDKIIRWKQGAISMLANLNEKYLKISDTGNNAELNSLFE